VDGDGTLDLVLVARNQLYAWRLDAPMSSLHMPWPMYQRDLANTGTLPLPPVCSLAVLDPVLPWFPSW